MAEENGSDDEDLGQEIVLDQGSDTDDSPRVSKPAVESDDGDDSELESYSKGVQKRIARLTEKYRKEERDRSEAVRLAQQLWQDKQQLESRLQQLDSGYLSEYGARIEAQLVAARRGYRDAHEAGDTDRMIEAQEALSRATSDKDRYDIAKRRADMRTAAPQHQQQEPVYQQAPQRAPQPQQPRVDPKAQGWAEKNTWFGQDEVMTYAAFGVHRKLVEEEGFDPQSDDYYNEIDRRLRKEFPHKFRESTTSGRSQVAPAGSSASRSTKQGRRTVRLSPSQIAIAKRLNVPLEEYAKYVKD